MRKWGLLLLAGMLLLAGCGEGQAVTSEPAATATAPVRAGDTAVAEATIEPARWSELRFETGGVVADLLIAVGETVEAGDVIARLDIAEAESAVREAEFALAAAEAELALLRTGPRAEEIAAAEADLEDAEAALARAIAQRDEVTGGATKADIAAAQAEVTAAEEEWLKARDERDDLYRHTDGDDKEEREQIDYRFHAAREALAAAQTKLEAQRNAAGGQVREAEARVASASAQRDVVKAELILLEADSAPWEVALAEAEIAQAAVALKLAKATLERAVLRAPFAGTVTKIEVEVGSLVEPGQSVAVLATLDQLEAHTVDLMELDVARLQEGQAAMVTADALPETKLQGRVARIGLRSVEYRGDVTYPVIVELEEAVPGLRWGMTAIVEIELD